MSKVAHVKSGFECYDRPGFMYEGWVSDDPREAIVLYYTEELGMSHGAATNQLCDLKIVIVDQYGQETPYL